jgi:hypothetical protein
MDVTVNTPCRHYSALLVCLAFLLGFKQVSAQATGEAQPDYAPVSASDAAEGLLKLDTVVTDKSGNPVTTLEPKDFTLLENDHTDKILSFHAFDGVTIGSRIVGNLKQFTWTKSRLIGQVAFPMPAHVHRLSASESLFYPAQFWVSAPFGLVSSGGMSLPIFNRSQIEDNYFQK